MFYGSYCNFWGSFLHTDTFLFLTILAIYISCYLIILDIFGIWKFFSIVKFVNWRFFFSFFVTKGNINWILRKRKIFFFAIAQSTFRIIDQSQWRSNLGSSSTALLYWKLDLKLFFLSVVLSDNFHSWDLLLWFVQ